MGSRSRSVRENLGRDERGFEGLWRTHCRGTYDGDKGRLPISRRGGFGQDQLITSFEAKAGDNLIVAVDLRGAWHGEKPFWNASVGAPSERLRADLDLLPALAENGWCRAGKDISNGGIVGTLAMLLDCSSAAELWVDRLPRPQDVNLERWLISFPSFGYLLSVSPEYSERVIALFASREIGCAVVGKITSAGPLFLCYGAAREPFPLSEALGPHATSR